MNEADLQALLRAGETQNVECKVVAPRLSELAERICGFANADGGTIILGVADETWEIIGLERPQDNIDALLKAARLCKPAVYFAPPPQELEYQGKRLVVAVVPPSAGPIYQASGIFYIRKGTMTVPLELAEVAQLLYQRGLLAWETRPVAQATMADLDMSLVEQYLKARAQANPRSNQLDPERLLINLGCAVDIGGDGHPHLCPTNAGLLLFGRSPQDFLLNAEVTCVLYRDELGLYGAVDQRILHGTIPQQIDQAESFLRQHIPIATHVEGFHRIEEPDYPIDALREGLVNSLAHRDYSLQGEAVRVFYYPWRIEIRSPGRLLPGLRLEEVRQGRAPSKPRNPVIATVLRDLPGNYMERIGVGISFMIRQMRERGLEPPQFREQGEFIVTFLKERAERREPASPSERTTSAAASGSPEVQMPALAQEEEVDRLTLALRYVHKHGAITNQQYRELTGVSESTALRDLERLVEQGTLRAIGKRRSRKYVL